MKQNIFKKLLSYITEIHIESVQSDYNESLQVFLKTVDINCVPPMQSTHMLISMIISKKVLIV